LSCRRLIKLATSQPLLDLRPEADRQFPAKYDRVPNPARSILLPDQNEGDDVSLIIGGKTHGWTSGMAYGCRKTAKVKTLAPGERARVRADFLPIVNDQKLTKHKGKLLRDCLLLTSNF